MSSYLQQTQGKNYSQALPVRLPGHVVHASVRSDVWFVIPRILLQGENVCMSFITQSYTTAFRWHVNKYNQPNYLFRGITVGLVGIKVHIAPGISSCNQDIIIEHKRYTQHTISDPNPNQRVCLLVCQMNVMGVARPLLGTLHFLYTNLATSETYSITSDTQPL